MDIFYNYMIAVLMTTVPNTKERFIDQTINDLTRNQNLNKETINCIFFQNHTLICI